MPPPLAGLILTGGVHSRRGRLRDRGGGGRPGRRRRPRPAGRAVPRAGRRGGGAPAAAAGDVLVALRPRVLVAGTRARDGRVVVVDARRRGRRP